MNSSSASGIWQGRWRLRLLGTSSRFRFYEYHLLESVHPDARPLGRARDTTVALGVVEAADGSAMAMIDCTFCNDQFKGTIFNQRKGGVDGILVQTLAVSLNDDGRVGILSGDSKEVKRFCQQREEEAYLELELHCLLIYLHYLLEMHIDRSYCRGRVHYGNSHHRVIGFVQSACVLV